MASSLSLNRPSFAAEMKNFDECQAFLYDCQNIVVDVRQTSARHPLVHQEEDCVIGDRLYIYSLIICSPPTARFTTIQPNHNFVPAIGKAASIAQGETPVLVFWDYNALAARDNLKGNPKVDVIVPESGVVAGVYVQAISAYAPHPNAAKLWLEHLYSDEGQIAWLKGYCHPIRFANLVEAGKVPADVLAALPPRRATPGPSSRRSTSGRRPRKSSRRNGTVSSARRWRNRRIPSPR